MVCKVFVRFLLGFYWVFLGFCWVFCWVLGIVGCNSGGSWDCWVFVGFFVWFVRFLQGFSFGLKGFVVLWCRLVWCRLVG